MVTLVLVIDKEEWNVVELKAYQEGNLSWEDIRKKARWDRRDFAEKYSNVKKYSILEGYAESVEAFFRGYPEYAPRKKTDLTIDTHRLDEIVRTAKKEMMRG